ncbi:MAG: hypothetical protein AABX40_00630 [Candidatus Hydrothermarchaeota archaeon]
MAFLDQALTGQVLGTILSFIVGPKYRMYKYIAEIEEAAVGRNIHLDA